MHNAIPGSGRERCGGCALDEPVQLGMVTCEVLVMGEISWPVSIVQGHDQTRERAPDTAGCLDIFRVLFGLTGNNHQAETVNVHADGNHVCSDSGIETLPRVIPIAGCLQKVKFFRDLIGRHTGSDLNVLHAVKIALLVLTILFLDSEDSLWNVVLQKPDSTSKLTDTVEITDQ